MSKPNQTKGKMALILIFMVAAIFWICLAYFLIKPLNISINTVPAGASVTVNGNSVCPTTPCRFSFNRISSKRIIIDKATYFNQIIKVPSFGMGWKTLLSKDIVLQSMVSEEDKKSGLKKCHAKRSEESDQLNVDTYPCYRVPPKIPWRAKESGHCHAVFDVSSRGNPQNIRTNGCTDSLFEAPTLSAVSLWVYLTKIEDGKEVLRKNVKSKITFRLRDELGNYIPEPSYFEQYEDHSHEISVHKSFDKNKAH